MDAFLSATAAAGGGGEESTDGRVLRWEDIHTNWQYRRYMVSHGNAVRVNNALDSQSQFGYAHVSSASTNPRENGAPTLQASHLLYDAITNVYDVPFVYASAYDARHPRGYEDSDLKRQFLWTAELEGRLVAPMYRGSLPGSGGGAAGNKT